jgi:hypothetical protein
MSHSGSHRDLDRDAAVLKLRMLVQHVQALVTILLGQRESVISNSFGNNAAVTFTKPEQSVLAMTFSAAEPLTSHSALRSFRNASH